MPVSALIGGMKTPTVPVTVSVTVTVKASTAPVNAPAPTATTAAAAAAAIVNVPPLSLLPRTARLLAAVRLRLAVHLR